MKDDVAAAAQSFAQEYKLRSICILVEAVLLGDLFDGINWRAQLMQNAVMNIVNPAVDTQFLSTSPRVLYDVAAGNIVDLMQYV